MYVVGTAGHVDHGKSTLVKALTGIDPDRLKEEKDRQMTIDLGFAWYQLPSGNEVGIVDVPGHRDFIDNMLAGVGGIDAVLLIIAADEGVMPQTREHLSILKLLQVRNGLIVLTKADLVEDPEWLEMVESDIRNLARNSFLDKAPILRVSAVKSQGLTELAEAIDAMLAECPPKTDRGKARLPIDRVFSVKGFGTVVTGTLIDGSFNNGQQVEILPEGRQARIRGLQNHKKKVETALPGNRTAINLSGVDASDLRRGWVVVNPGDYSPTRRLDARIEMLAGASGQIRHNDHLKCFAGAAQSLARVRVLGKQEIQPGGDGWVQLEFDDELVVEKGDRLILRRPSPGETIAGGVVLNTHPTQRYKRFSDATSARMDLMESGSAQQVLLTNLATKCPISKAEFLKVCGLEEVSAKQLIEQLSGDEIIQISAEHERVSLLVTRVYWEVFQNKVIGKLEKYFQDYPLRQRMEKTELIAYLKINPKLGNLMLRQMAGEGKLDESGGRVGLANRSVQLLGEFERKAKEILAEYQAAPYAPPSSFDIIARYDPDLLPAMIDKHMLVQLTEDIALLPDIYERMVTEIKNFLVQEKKITLAQVRDMFQTSRKYALAILEHLDNSGVTQREDDFRVLKRS